MKRRNIGALPVVEGKKLIGVSTDRDIALRAVASGADVTKGTVREVMTRDPHFAYEGQTINEACHFR